MGNQQSAEHNRLSKPKTNKRSLRPSSHTDSPVSVMSRFSNLSTADRQHIKDTLLSPVEPPVALTEEHRATNESRASLSHERGRRWSFSSHTRSRNRSRSNSLSCLGDRSQLGDFQTSRVSLGQDPQLDVENAIRVLQEARKHASPEEIAALDSALSSVEHARPIHTDHKRSHTMHDVSSTPFTRRKSLIQTPGVGTRTSLDNHRKIWNSWKAPKLNPEEEAKWNAAPRYRTSRDPVASLKPFAHGRESPTQRAETPNDMDYSHLGSLKLGSLVVVNGVPSPALSSRTPLAPRTMDNADYFTARGFESSPLANGERRTRGHMKSKSSVLPRTPLTLDDDWMQDRQNDRQSLQNGAHWSGSPEPRGPRVSPDLHPEVYRGQEARDIETVNADDLAIAYQADIPKSPFAAGHDSRRSEDRCLSNVEVESPVRAEVDHIFEGTVSRDAFHGQKPSGITHTRVDSYVSDRDAMETKVHRAKQRPTARTYDSGYSSGGSLRLTNSNVTQAESSLQLQKTISLSSNDDWQQSAQRMLVKSNSQTGRTPAGETLGSTEQSSQLEAALSPISPRSVTSQTSFDSTYSATHKRLQKRRSLKTELPQVRNVQPVVESTIPEVPENVRADLSRHASQHHRAQSSSDVEIPSERKNSIQTHVDLPVQTFQQQPREQRTRDVNAQAPQQPNVALPRAKSMVHMSYREPPAQGLDAQMRDNQAHLQGQSRRRKSRHNLKIQTGMTRYHGEQKRKSSQDVPPVPSKSVVIPPPLFSAKPRLEGNPQDVQRSHLYAAAQPFDYHQVQPQGSSQYSNSEYSEHTSRDDMEGQSFARNMRRKSMGEGLRPHASLIQTQVSQAHTHTRSMNPDDTAAWGRYSGGLQYGYEGRAYGVGGSAGTRQLHSQASLKSTQWRKYGVDLSDVPVFLQKT